MFETVGKTNNKANDLNDSNNMNNNYVSSADTGIGGNNDSVMVNFGPQVYKALIFLLVEAHADAKSGSGFDGVLREYVANSFSLAIKNLLQVPIDVLVEPLLAQIQLIGCEIYDFHLIKSIINHPRLSSKGASLIANHLGRYALGHPIFWRVSSNLMARLVRKYQLQIKDSIITIVQGAIKLLPLAAKAKNNAANGQQQWLCICCLRAILEMSDTALRQSIADELINIQPNQITEDVRAIIDMSNEETSLQNLPSLDESMQLTLNNSNGDAELDRLVITSAGSDFGDIDGNNGNGGRRENKDRTPKKNSPRKKKKKDNNNNNNNYNDGGSTTPRSENSSRRGYRGEKVISATGLKGLRRENDETRRTGSPRSDRGTDNESARGRRRGASSNNNNNSNSNSNSNSKKEIGRVRRQQPRRSVSPRRELGTTSATPRYSKKTFVKTTLGASVEDDIQRISDKVKQKKIIQEEIEEEKRIKSLKIRKKMRKKFAHIKAIERPMSPRKPGQKRRSKREHVEARKLRADECYATALVVMQPWLIPLKNVFNHYVAISKGFVRHQSALEDFEETTAAWSTMQQNEYLMCFTDLGIVPNMISKREALHIFHMITTGANSPDSVNFELFRSILLVVTRQSGVVCQDQTTDVARVNALLSWLRIRNTKIELVFNLFNPENRDVQLGVKGFSERIGGVVAWEDGTTPEYDYSPVLSSRLRKDDLLGEAIVICIEIINDMCDCLFGWSVNVLFNTRDDEPRPNHATIGPKMCQKIVYDELIKDSGMLSDEFAVTDLKESEVQQEEIRLLLAVHARRSLSHNVGAKKYMGLYENILRNTKQLQIKAAAKGEFELKIVPKDKILLPHTKAAIKRLYKPAEPPPRVKIANRVGFGGGVPTKEKIEYEGRAKPRYRFGQSTLDKLHVRHVPPAKILIEVLSHIVDYVVSGKARKKLGAVYGSQYSEAGTELPDTLMGWDDIKKNGDATIQIGPKAHLPTMVKPRLGPKEKEKHTQRKKREDVKWVKLQHERDDERKKRKAVLQKNLEIQRERKKRELKKFHKEDRPRKEALALKQKKEAEQLAKRREVNKKRIAARKKKQEDDKNSAEKQKLDESSKSWKLSKKRAEEANKRQTEKHKKMHDEVVAKAKALGMSDKKIEETIKFDESNVSMTGSNSKQVRVRTEINKKHAAKMEREANIKAHDEHVEEREERVDDANARASVELGLKRALRQQLDDGTKKPFDYVR